MVSDVTEDLSDIIEGFNTGPYEREILIRALSEIVSLRAALTMSRGQWIHSVNAAQCLKALGEPIPDYVRDRA